MRRTCQHGDELGDKDQRARGCLGKTEGVDHLKRREPAAPRDDFLRHIGKDGIGAAEGHHGEFGEEDADFGEEGGANGFGGEKRGGPEGAGDGCDTEGAGGRWRGQGWRFGLRRCDSPDQACDQNHQREGQVKYGQRDKGRCGERIVQAPLEGAFGNAQERLEDDGDDRRFHTDEGGADQGLIPEREIEQRQRGNHCRTRQDEEQPGDDPAHDPAQLPAGIGGKLHRLGSGEHHAEGEGAQEFGLVQPFPIVHQFAVHERDLCGGTAERQKADTGKGAEEIGERHAAIGHKVCGRSRAMV